MSGDEEDLRRRLRTAAADVTGDPDRTWARAQQRVAARRRRRQVAGTAVVLGLVVALAGVAVVPLAEQTNDDVVLTEPEPVAEESEGDEPAVPDEPAEPDEPGEEPDPAEPHAAEEADEPEPDESEPEEPDESEPEADEPAPDQPEADEQDAEPREQADDAVDGDTAPVELPQAAPQEPAVLTEVRLGAHEGFDRVVWEFVEGDRPRVRVEYVEESDVARPGSGEEVAVAGEAHLRVSAAQATDVGADLYVPGAPAYDGPTRLDGLRSVREVIALGDFEAEMTWVVGVEGERPFEVTVLHDPLRIVIDVAHEDK